MRRLPNIILTVLAVMTCWPLVLSAQEKSGLRGAGNETRFRVIKRFEQPTPPPIKSVWPFSAALADALDREDWKTAHAELGSAKSIKTDEHRFLRGYVALKAKDHAAALKDLSKVAAGSSPLSEYGARFAAEAAFELKKYSEASGFAANVSTNTLLRPKAIWYLGESLSLSGRKDESTRAFRSLVASFPNRSIGRKTRAELAKRYASQKRWNDAAREWIALIESAPLSPEGKRAAKSLEKVRKSKKLSRAVAKEAAPSKARTLIIYRAKFAAHQSKQVSQELPKKIRKWKAGSDQWCEAAYLVGRSLTKLRDHGASEPWYRKVIASCKGSRLRNALYNGGKARWNAGDKDGAVSWFQRLWETFPEHSYADDAYYFAARIRREQGKAKVANRLITEQVKKYPKGDMAADSSWLRVRSLWAASDWNGVVSYVDGLEDAPQTSLYSDGRLTYFRARALSLAGKKKDALAAYRATVHNHPLSYYALLALNRVREMGSGNVCKEQPDLCAFPTNARTIPAADAKLATHGGYQRGLKLVELRLTKLARPELKRASHHVAKDPDQLWVIADALDRAGSFSLSHDIPRRNIKNWEDRYPELKAPRLWNIAYPRPFLPQVQAYAQKRGIPEALVYGIIREESGFNPGVESWANARGLMQLIEPTARLMAQKDGLKFSWNDLFTPETGIRLGSRYLKGLSDEFKANPALIIAGYNGGKANVNRWLTASAGADLDILVEDIPFGQTRKYTKRVLRSYWVYSYLNGTKVPVVSMSLGTAE